MSKKANSPSLSEQRLSAWSAAVSRALGELAGEEASGGSPFAQKTPLSGQESLGDLIWWKCTEEPEISFGIGSEAQAALLNLRNSGTDAPSETDVQNVFREMMDAAWGNPGAISIRQSGDEIQAWRFQLGEGKSLDIVAAFQPAIQAKPTSNLGMLLDIELPLTLRFGSAQMAMREVAGLVTGSVIELDRGIDEPIEIMINGHVIARGEAVTVGGAYGVRISEVSSRRESWVASSVPSANPAITGEKSI